MPRERPESCVELEAEQAQISLREGIERSRITQELAIDTQRIRREVELQRLEVERRKSLEIAEQLRAIAVADQSRAQSEALAAAELARAKAIAAEEEVFTTREIAVAERRKQVELIAAAQEAERSTKRLLIEAEAEKKAAEDRAAAHRLLAEGDAEADKIRAVAAKLRHEIEAEGRRLMNEADNIRTPESRASAMRMFLIERLDSIIRESVKPMEKIDEIKIFHVDGLVAPGGGSSNGEGRNYGSASLTDELVNSALRYRAHAPLIDKLLKEIGLSGGSLSQLAGNDLLRLAGAMEGDGGSDQLDPHEDTARNAGASKVQAQ